MTINEIYNKLKSECELPVGVFMYITYYKKGYECGNTISLSFREEDKKESINKIQQIINNPNYYSFFLLDKGKQFLEDNKLALNEAFCNLVLCNAGYSNSIICKN